MNTGRVLLAIAGFVLAASYAAASPCPITTLSSIQNSSCSIGGVQFNFQNAVAINTVVNNLTTGASTTTALDLSSITFTPYVSGNQAGFTLGGLPGESATMIGDNWDDAVLYFTSSVTSGAGSFLTGPQVNASTDATSGASGLAESEIYGQVYDPSGNGTAITTYIDAISQFGSTTTTLSSQSHNYNYNCCLSSIGIENSAQAYNDWTFQITNVGTASANASFTSATYYVTSPVTPVPEPATLTLFGTGMLAAAAILRKRIRN